jgi:hypothetical protein
MVRFRTEPRDVPEIEREIATLFGAVAAAGPDGMRNLAARTVDQPEFVLLLHLGDGTPNPLPAIPAAAGFRDRLPGWARTSPAPCSLDVLGDYRMLG